MKTEDEMKIELIESAAKHLEEEKAIIQARIDAAKCNTNLSRGHLPTAAIHFGSLAALDNYAKKELKNAIDSNYLWISFAKNGSYGAISDENDGLTNYRDTEIVF